MRTSLAILAVLLVAAVIPACAPTTPDAFTPPAPRTEEPKPAPAAAQAHTPTAAPTASPAAAKPTAAKPTATITRAAPNSSRQTLTLKVTSPLDESVVNASPVTVSGQTIPGAVVSVNGDLAVVDAAGRFHMTVNLDEGPNVLEIVASDDNGSELSAILRLIYEP